MLPCKTLRQRNRSTVRIKVSLYALIKFQIVDYFFSEFSQQIDFKIERLNLIIVSSVGISSAMNVISLIELFCAE